MTTNREAVLAYLVERPYKNLSVTDISEHTGLTRRQTITALNGLKNKGLESQLAPSGSGHWVFDPPFTEKFDNPDDVTTFVPVGWETTIRVVARFGEDRYLIAPLTETGEDTGLRLWSSPVVGGIEYLPDGAFGAGA